MIARTTVKREAKSTCGGIREFSVDADDFKRAAALMRLAGLDAKTIAWVLAEMAAANGEHE